MAFVVMNTVRGSKEDLPGILVDVQRFGLAGIRGQRGFLSARLMMAEDETEALLMVEWESRDDFVAYRQTEAGRAGVEAAMRLHPQINFYDVVATLDPPGQ